MLEASLKGQKLQAVKQRWNINASSFVILIQIVYFVEVQERNKKFIYLEP